MSTDNQRLDVPGRASIHDKRDPNRDVAYYQCPFCNFSKDVGESERGKGAEYLVRLHITSEDDGKHKNRNGFLDTIKVQAYDENAEVIEDIDSPKTTNVDFDGDESIEFLPEGVNPDSRAAEILTTAFKNPNDSPLDIAEKVYGDREKNAYVYKTLDNHLSTAERERRANSNSGSGFDNLSEVRQHTISAILQYPEASNTEIVEIADSSEGTVYNVKKENETIIEHMKAKGDTGSEVPYPPEDPASDDESDVVEEADAEGEVDEAESEPITEAETEPAVDAVDEEIALDCETVDELGQTLTQLTRFFESQDSAAPEGGDMDLFAKGGFHVLGELGEIVSDVEYFQEEYPEVAERVQAE